MSLFFIFLTGGVILVLIINHEMRLQALQTARQEAKLLISHSYTDLLHLEMRDEINQLSPDQNLSDVRLWMYSLLGQSVLTQPAEGNDSAYRFRQTFQQSLSPDLLANQNELDFIQRLNQDATLQGQGVVEWIDAKPYFTWMERGLTVEEACLKCHTSQQEAPTEIQKEYGNAIKFDFKPGQVASLYSVQIPLDPAYHNANIISLRISIGLISLLALLFIIQWAFYNRLIFTPLAIISYKSQQISKNPHELRQPIQMRLVKELHELAKSFNQMSMSLLQNQTELEERVEQRANQLTAANQKLLLEAQDRDRAQKNYQGLFEQMLDGFALHEIICDESGRPIDYRFLSINPAFEKLTGLSADEIIGKRVLDVLPNTERIWIESYGKVALEGISLHFTNYSTAIGKYFEVQAFRPQPGQFAVICADITGRIQFEQQIQKQVGRLSALRQIDRAISEMLPLEMTLQIFLEQVIRELQVEAAEVVMRDERQTTLHLEAQRGFRTPSPRFNLDDRLARRVLADGKRVILNDLGQEAEVPHFIQQEGFLFYAGCPLETNGQVIGVLQIYSRAPLAPEEDWLWFLDTLAGQGAIAIQAAELWNRLQQSNLALQKAYDATLEGWVHALDLRDEETEGHTLRVTELTVKLARALEIPPSEIEHIRRGALLHDIGKIGIPDAILHKPGALSPEEWEIMRKHTVYAYELLYPVEFLRPVLDIPYCHHEKWDGSGYPRGLAGEGIPYMARIFSVVDVWDALLSDRPYRPAWPKARVVDYMLDQSGKQFDPAIVKIFIDRFARGEEA